MSWLNGCWDTAWEDALEWGRLLFMLVVGLAAVLSFTLGVCYLLTRHLVAWSRPL